LNSFNWHIIYLSLILFWWCWSLQKPLHLFSFFEIKYWKLFEGLILVGYDLVYIDEIDHTAERHIKFFRNFGSYQLALSHILPGLILSQNLCKNSIPRIENSGMFLIYIYIYNLVYLSFNQCICSCPNSVLLIQLRNMFYKIWHFDLFISFLLIFIFTLWLSFN
jgi:hypothetical protein